MYGWLPYLCWQIYYDRRYPISSIMGKTPSKTETTPFGTKHTYHTTSVGKDGKSVNARVVVVIQKDNGSTTYKIVTVYPD